MPETPKGARSAKWCALNAVNAIAENSTSTAILIITMTALALADSLAPRINRTAHITTKTIAGRLTMPGSASHGPAEIVCGRTNPKTLSEQFVQILTPPDGHRGGGHAVFEQ